MRDSYGLYVEQLQGEYKETFEQIMTYMATQQNDINSEESQMGELLDTFLQAQEEGMPVHKIVGNDLEAFCKNFCSQFGWESKVLNVVDRFKSVAWFIFVFSAGDLFFLLWDFLAGEQVDWFAVDAEFNYTGYILGFVMMGIVFTILDFITTRMMFKCSKESFAMKTLNVVRIVIAVGCFILCCKAMFSEKFNLFQLPLWILFFISGLYLILYYTFNRKRVKENKENKISFWKMVQEQSSADTDKTMEDKFASKNKWRQRFGRKLLTRDEFISLEEKDCKVCEKAKYLFIALPIIICIWMCVDEYLHNGFESPVDLIFCLVIVLIVETAVMYFFFKVVSISVEDRMKWIKKEREKVILEQKEDNV